MTDASATSEKLRWINGITVDPRLSATDKVVGILLIRYRNASTGQCNPSREVLADELGFSVRAVGESLAKLKAAGWIRWRRSRSSNWYQFDVSQVSAMAERTASLAAARHERQGQERLPDRNHSSHLKAPDRIHSSHLDRNHSSHEHPKGTRISESDDSEITAGARATKPEASTPSPSSRTEAGAFGELAQVLDEEHAAGVVQHREMMGSPLSRRAAKWLAREFAKCPDPNAAAECMVRSGWRGFEVSWMSSRQGGSMGAPPLRGFDALGVNLAQRISEVGDEEGAGASVVGPENETLVAMHDPKLFELCVWLSGRSFLAQANSGTFPRTVTAQARGRVAGGTASLPEPVVTADPIGALDERSDATTDHIDDRPGASAAEPTDRPAAPPLAKARGSPR